jgi:hypothetical protein
MMQTQSMFLQAGNTPVVLMHPSVGLKPTIPLRAAGTLVLPPVSVQMLKDTSDAATLTAEPDELPPEM